ncbi:hypothetical protein BC829DRAFT_441684 [Chytridium lagenaria]|nr:hypothetical protein BC829DRAFT_441684 [Chytridium lagenaria]
MSRKKNNQKNGSAAPKAASSTAAHVKPSLSSLLNWYATSGIEVSKDLVSVEKKDLGFVVMSKTDIPSESVIAKIPSTSILLLTLFQRKKVLDNIDCAGLALALLHEKSRGASSPWAAYIQHLPTRVHIPIFWSDEEKALLKGTDLALMLDDMKFEEAVFPFIWHNLDAFGMKGKGQDGVEKVFYDAMSVVISKRIEVDAVHGFALVPFVDLLKHSSSASNVFLDGIVDDDDDEESSYLHTSDLIDDDAEDEDAPSPSSATFLTLTTTEPIPRSTPLLITFADDLDTTMLTYRGFSDATVDGLIVDNPNDGVVIGRERVVEVVKGWGREAVRRVERDVVLEVGMGMDDEEDDDDEMKDFIVDDDEVEEDEDEDDEDEELDEDESDEEDKASNRKKRKVAFNVGDDDDEEEEDEDGMDEDDEEEGGDSDEDDDEDDDDLHLSLLPNGLPTASLRVLIHLIVISARGFKAISTSSSALLLYVRQLIERLIVGGNDEGSGWVVQRRFVDGDDDGSTEGVVVKTSGSLVQKIVGMVIGETVKKREVGYGGGSLEEDEQTLKEMPETDSPERLALILRVQERRILKKALERVDKLGANLVETKKGKGRALPDLEDDDEEEDEAADEDDWEDEEDGDAMEEDEEDL